jgi:glycosyltransferase involved in cell wall biosynthesis
VSVLTTDVSGALPPVEVDDGLMIRRFAAWPASRDYYLSPALLHALWEGHYDLVHVQGIHTPMQPLALVVAQRRTIPTVLTFHTGGHSNRLRTAIRRPQWAVQRHVLRRTDRLIAVCEFEAQLFGAQLGDRASSISVIRNGAEALPVSARPPRLTGDPLVLSIGRLERYKGHHRAIAAMPPLLVRRPGARLVIVGTGPFEDALRQQIGHLGVQEQVTLTNFGPDERSELGALVASSDAAVLLSDYEANPIAVMEALAFGVDVLAADTSGLAELGRAGLVNTIDPDASADATAAAIVETAEAHRWASGPPKLPTWDGCTDQLLEVYESVLARSVAPT